MAAVSSAVSAKRRITGIRATGDQLGGGLAVDGVMHLVLHRGEKLLSQGVARVVIHAGGVNVGDALQEASGSSQAFNVTPCTRYQAETRHRLVSFDSSTK